MPCAPFPNEPPTDSDDIRGYYSALLDDTVGSDLRRWLTHYNLARDAALHAQIPSKVWAMDVYRQQREAFMERSQGTVRLVHGVVLAALYDLIDRFEEMIKNAGVGLDAEELRPAADSTAIEEDEGDMARDLVLHDSAGSSMTVMALGPQQQLEEREKQGGEKQQEQEEEQVEQAELRQQQRVSPSLAALDSADDQPGQPPGNKNPMVALSDTLSGSSVSLKRRLNRPGRHSESASKRRRQTNGRLSETAAHYDADGLDGALQLVQPPLHLLDVGPGECVFRYPTMPEERLFVLRCDRAECQPGCEQAARWQDSVIFKAWPFGYGRALRHFGGEAHNLHDKDAIFRRYAREVLDANEPQNTRPKPRGSRGPRNANDGGARAQDDNGDVTPTIVASFPDTLLGETESHNNISQHNSPDHPYQVDRSDGSSDRTTRPQPVPVIEIEDDADDDYRHYDRPARRFAEPPGAKTYTTRMRTHVGNLADILTDEETDVSEGGSGSEYESGFYI